MGEYATHGGRSVKIGTCEEMYYLRADQAFYVLPEDGNVDPLRQAEHLRFRFPFPDEDGIKPGQFEDYNRSVSLWGMRAPAELADQHSSIQFVASHGYNACLPCPESIQDAPTGLGAIKVAEGIHVHRNGFKGATFLAQQRLVDGQLLPILHCACGMAWRVEDPAELLGALMREHKRYCDRIEPRPDESFYSKLHDRVLQGFDREYVASLGFETGVQA